MLHSVTLVYRKCILTEIDPVWSARCGTRAGSAHAVRTPFWVEARSCSATDSRIGIRRTISMKNASTLLAVFILGLGGCVAEEETSLNRMDNAVTEDAINPAGDISARFKQYLETNGSVQEDLEMVIKESSFSTIRLVSGPAFNLRLDSLGCSRDSSGSSVGECIRNGLSEYLGKFGTHDSLYLAGSSAHGSSKIYKYLQVYDSVSVRGAMLLVRIRDESIVYISNSTIPLLETLLPPSDASVSELLDGWDISRLLSDAGIVATSNDVRSIRKTIIVTFRNERHVALPALEITVSTDEGLMQYSISVMDRSILAVVPAVQYSVPENIIDSQMQYLALDGPCINGWLCFSPPGEIHECIDDPDYFDVPVCVRKCTTDSQCISEHGWTGCYYNQPELYENGQCYLTSREIDESDFLPHEHIYHDGYINTTYQYHSESSRLVNAMEQLIASHTMNLNRNSWSNGIAYDPGMYFSENYRTDIVSNCYSEPYPPLPHARNYNCDQSGSFTPLVGNPFVSVYQSGLGQFRYPDVYPTSALSRHNLLGHEWGHAIRFAECLGYFGPATFCWNENYASMMGSLNSALRVGLSDIYYVNQLNYPTNGWLDETWGLNSNTGKKYAQRSRFDWNDCIVSVAPHGYCNTYEDCPPYEACDSGTHMCKYVSCERYNQAIWGRMLRIFTEGTENMNIYCQPGNPPNWCNGESLGITLQPIQLEDVFDVFGAFAALQFPLAPLKKEREATNRPNESDK